MYLSQRFLLETLPSSSALDSCQYDIFLLESIRLRDNCLFSTTLHTKLTTMLRNNVNTVAGSSQASSTAGGRQDFPQCNTRSAKPFASATHWSNKEIDQLVLKAKEAKASGQTSNKGFPTAVWTMVAASYSDPLKQVAKTCESKWAGVGKAFREVKFLREASGFGWDDNLKLVTAEPPFWAKVAKVSNLLFRILIASS
jgi:hypothetical protein